MSGRKRSKRVILLSLVLITILLSAYAVLAGKASNRTFGVADNPPSPGHGNHIADKEINQPFTVYVFVTNSGGNQIKDTATNVNVTLVDDNTGHTLKSFPAFNLSAYEYKALTTSYNQAARVHFHLSGTIEGNLVSANSNSFNIGEAGDMPANFYLEAYLDSGLTQPLNAPSADSNIKLKAGQPFYIKITARNADGSTNTTITYNTAGKNNIVGTISALDDQGETYDDATFPAISNTAFTDVSPGVGRAPAVFYDVGIIGLNFANSLGVPTSSPNVGRFYPDHFAITSAYGVPLLQIRGDIGGLQNSLPDDQRKWGYLGESMTVSLDLGAYASNGQLTENYSEEFAKFNNDLTSQGNPGWGISLTGSGGDYTPRVELSSVGSFKDGIAELRPMLTVNKDQTLLSREQITNFNLSLNPIDSDGVKLSSSPVQARVLGNSGLLSGPYNLYGGRIHVAGGYYTQQTVLVPVQVERWDGGTFVLNTLDSQSDLEQWTFTEVGGPPDVLTISGTPFTFAAGSGAITVKNNGGSEINRTLGLTPGAFPSYLDLRSDILAWGQIVEPGGPPVGQDGGVIWEKEQLP